MSRFDQNIFGIRLKHARKMAGISLQTLSDNLENKVTKQSLNKYEQGLMKPTSEVLLALSKVLNVNPDYFLKKDLIALGKIYFRKKTTLSKNIEQSIIEKAKDYVERYLELENLLGISTNFKNPLKGKVIKDRIDVEKAANKLRSDWELGIYSIPNLVEMLEMKGIKVLLIDDSDEIDGFAAFSSNGVPIVVVNIRGKSIERIRFTIIHELAHVLLQFEKKILDDKRLIEKLCHYFSSCFLIPEKMLLEMIGGMKRSYIAIKELIRIKEYYGVSIRAIIHRLMELEVISQNYYQKWMIYLNKTYGSKDEPGNYNGEENKVLFQQLIDRALSEGLISFSKAAALSNKSIEAVRKEYLSVK